MVTELEEKGDTQKMVIRTKHKHNVLTKNGTIVQEEQMRESASEDGIFVAS